jgi:glycosyltransferase involved in cell wall biosynthesis
MRILITSNHGNTFYPKEGADIRKNKLALGLAKKNDVTVLESDRYIANETEVPSNISIERYHEYFLFGKPLSFLLDLNPSFVSKLYGLLNQDRIDIIQISFPYGFLATKLCLWLLKKKIPVIYDAHNVEKYTTKQISLPDCSCVISFFLTLYVPILEWLAIKLTADYIISVSDTDRLNFITEYNLNGDRIKVIPSGTTIRSWDDTRSKETLKKEMGISNVKVILFHGTYSYPPNREAFDLIIDYIAPQAKAADNVVFLLAGNKTPIFEKDNVRSLGFVEDIDSLLHVADIAIVPLLRGGGTKLKILDYLGAGLPIVTTRKGIEGIDVRNGKDAIVVDEVNKRFIEAILSLVDNDEQRNILGQNGRRLAEEKYGWDRIGESLDVYYNHINNRGGEDL